MVWSAVDKNGVLVCEFISKVVHKATVMSKNPSMNSIKAHLPGFFWLSYINHWNYNTCNKHMYFNWHKFDRWSLIIRRIPYPTICNRQNLSETEIKATIKISIDQGGQITAICDKDTNWFSMTMIPRYCHTTECRSISHYALRARTKVLIMLLQLLKQGANRMSTRNCVHSNPGQDFVSNPLIYVTRGV